MLYTLEIIKAFNPASIEISKGCFKGFFSVGFEACKGNTTKVTFTSPEALKEGFYNLKFLDNNSNIILEINSFYIYARD